MKTIIKLLCIIFFLIGCELFNQDTSYQEYYVIESYLVANDSLPSVRLSTTSEISEEYSFSDNAIAGASVEIRLLNADSSVVKTFSYQQERPGVYQPKDTAIVQDERLYELHITTPGGDKISAFTYVPGSFETVLKPKDTYIYQGKEQVELMVTPSSYITDRQSYYIFTVNVVDPKEKNLTPFYRDLIESQDNWVQSYYINSSGIINEEKYQRNAEGNINLVLPWLTVVFYGSNDVIINAIDDNMHSFLRSRDVQTGGIALAPGEIQNIDYNVSGGIGIFGSMASDTNRVVILRPEN